MLYSKTNLFTSIKYMKKHISIIIFVTLFISIVSILAILAARGYNLTGTEITESGILNIESKPKGSNILINGENKGTTPDKIELVSGKYEIEIQKDSYTKWKKEVNVEPGIVSDLKVTLFPEELNLEQMTFTSIDKAFFSDKGDIIVYTIIKGDNAGIWQTKIEQSIFDIASSPSTKISDIDIIPNKCKSNYHIKLSKSNKKLILTCNLDDYVLYNLLNIQNLSEEPINLNEELGFNPDRVNFSFDSNNLIVKQQNTFFNYNTETQITSLIKLPENQNEFDYTYLENKLLLLEYNYNKDNRYLNSLNSNLQKEPILLPEELDISIISSINGSRDNTYTILSTNQSAYVIQTINSLSEPLTLSEKPVKILSWSPNGQSFIFTDTDENTLKSCTIKELPNDERKLNISTVLNNFNEENFVIKWNHNSEQLIINNTLKNQIYSLYKDGSNKKSLFEDTISEENNFIISENEIFLVVLIQDEETNSNLYSVKLSI